MPHKKLLYVFVILLLAAPAGCQPGRRISSSIKDQFLVSGRKSVDLAAAVPGTWNRVCILGPYSSNAVAKQVLGFDWDAESRSSIKTNEGISLLLFVQDQRVVDYVEHSRAAGDFTNLAGRCFSDSSTKFVQVTQPQDGWPGLFPPDEVQSGREGHLTLPSNTTHQVGPQWVVHEDAQTTQMD